MKARKILSVIMAIAMIAAFAVSASAAEEVTLPDGVTVGSFGDNTVTDGTNYYATLQSAVEAVCGTDGATLYCKPSADVGSLQHAPVTASLTVYGNGAYVSGGSERDFDIGNTDPSGGEDITADMTLTVKNLDGCGAWGTKATEHTVNLVFENCDNMGKVYITGTEGVLNITMTDCSFKGVIAEAVYSNADGDITLTNVSFSNLNKAINLNHKAAGVQTVTLSGCTFTDCGNDVASDQIPVRVLSSVEGGESKLTVSGCSFTGTPEGGADILLDYGVGTTIASIETTAANILEQNENDDAVMFAVTESDSFTNVETATPVAKIGNTEYTDLQTAIDEAVSGDTVMLIDDIEIALSQDVHSNSGKAGLYIKSDDVVVLDLNGHNISAVANDAEKYNYVVYISSGKLTINDSVGTGCVSLKTTASKDLSNVITNYSGTLIVNGGTFKSDHIDNVSHFVIDSRDTHGNVYTEINGGTFILPCCYTMRQCKSDYHFANDFVITGGEVSGALALWLQNADGTTTVPFDTSLTITGGTLTGGATYGSVFVGGTDNWTATDLLITGGNFNGGIQLKNDAVKKELTGFVSGGTYSGAFLPTDEMLADGYKLTENSDGTYSVVKEATVDPAFGTTLGVARIGANEEDYELVLLGAIDTLNYKDVGFEITFNDVVHELKTKTVYTKITSTDAESEEVRDYTSYELGGAENGYVFGQMLGFALDDIGKQFSCRLFAINLNNEYIYGKTWTIPVSE